MAGTEATSRESCGEVFAAVYQRHYRPLVRLAAYLLSDPLAAEDIVQEAFVRVESRRLADKEGDYGLGYLRRTVVNLTRSSWRRRMVVRRKFPELVASAARVDHSAYEAFQRLQMVQALQGLPRRQMEVIVLRYYEDLTEAEIAQVLGVSVGAVKGYCSRGLTALRQRLEDDDDHA